MIKNFEVKSYSVKESLLSSIIFFILGAILVFDPNGIIRIISYILGAIFIILALSKFILYRKMAILKAGSITDLASGIVFTGLGIVCFAFFEWIETAFRFIAAFYILYIGINRLIFALSLMKEHYEHAIGGIVTSSFMILFGILLCFIPGLPFRIIGWFILGYSVMEMIGFVLFSGKNEKKNTNEKKTNKKDEIEEAEIVEEKNSD